MALPATLVWEIRPTNGTANAGGGFDPSVASAGTDFSQQDAVQQAYTDLVIGASNTVTSAAHPFAASSVGNNITITGGTGFTTGIYSIRSHDGAVTVTLDRSPGTLASTGGTGNLGGARSGFSNGTNTLQAALVAGNKAWVKNEAWNEAVTFTVNGSAGTPITVEGYNASRGDAPTESGRPTNNRASAAGTGITTNANLMIFLYLRVTAAGGSGFSGSGSDNLYVQCRSDTGGSRGWNTGGNPAKFIGCEADGNTLYGYDGNSARTLYVGCTAHDNSSAGFWVSDSSVAVFCISETNADDGFATGGGGISLVNCVSYGNTGGSTDGVAVATPSSSILNNNIFSTNGRYGANATDGDSMWFDYNDYFANSTAARNNVPIGPHDTTADPQFTNAAGGNFSIGTNLKEAGYPGVFPGATTTGYLDIGAAQRQEPAAAAVTAPMLAGLIVA